MFSGVVEKQSEPLERAELPAIPILRPGDRGRCYGPHGRAAKRAGTLASAACTLALCHGSQFPTPISASRVSRALCQVPVRKPPSHPNMSWCCHPPAVTGSAEIRAAVAWAEMGLGQPWGTVLGTAWHPPPSSDREGLALCWSPGPRGRAADESQHAQ